MQPDMMTIIFAVAAHGIVGKITFCYLEVGV